MDATNAWLNFVSTLIWQLIIVATLLGFRRQISALIQRIATFKLGDTEFTFQQQSEDAASPGGAAEEDLDLADPEGFFTNDGVRKLIADSQLVSNGEIVRNPFLLFSTTKQRTWLVPTNRQLLCVLDDEGTRINRRLIQWHIPIEDAKPISTEPYKANSGLLHIGKKRNWIYSKSLHPSPMRLEREIQELVSEANKSA